MNTWQKILTFLVAVSLLAGCAAQNPYTYTGAGLGAALGAGLGAAINNRNPWKGAAIGGLLGAAGGGVAGEAYGRSNPYPQRQGYYYQPNAAPAPNYGYNAPANPDYAYNQPQPYYNQTPTAPPPGSRPAPQAYYYY